MKRYTPKFTCPKCGSDDGAWALYMSGANMTVAQMMTDYAPVEQGMILRKCAHCGYFEYQLSLDAPNLERMNMKRYTPEFACPKCGSNDVARALHMSGANMDTAHSLSGEEIIPGTIFRRCSRCGYNEFQLPLDAPEAETKDEENV